MPTSSSSSTSSSSGPGGAPPTCDELALTGPPITYDATFEHGWRPSLVPATEDGSLVSLAFWQQPPEGPAIPPLRLSNVTFEPWGAWPVGLGPAYDVLSYYADSFAVAPAMPSSQPGFATLFYIPTGSFPSDMGLAPAAAPKTHYDPFPTPIEQWDSFEPGWAVALARGAQGHLALYEGGGPYTFLGITHVTPNVVETYHGIACADAPFPAASIPTKDGFLVAAASGRPFDACVNDDGIPGPAKEVQVSRLALGTGEFTPTTSFEEPDPIAHLVLAKAAEGGWLVWQSNGESALQPPPIHAVRLDESGAPSSPIFNVTQDGQSSMPFAAAALGPLLAVAWVDALDPSSPTLQLQLFDEKGTFVTGASHSTAPSWLYDASLSLHPSPDGRHLLLAWADYQSGGPFAAVTRVARFSCGGVL